MSCYYTAAVLSDTPDQQGTSRRYALTATLLDPFRETRLKAALLFRVLFGRAAFDHLRRMVRNHA
jgi:hypothetical protein